MSTKGTILVVDDTPANLELLVDSLTAAGYQVFAADSGELALAAVAARPPELILLDIHMPGLDGFEVCRRLKAQAESRDIPVVCISSSGETAEQVEGLKLGAVDFITKPFQRQELLARIQTHLELRRLRVRAEEQATSLRRANAQLQAELAEHKRAEDALRASELRYRRLFESAKDGILILDAETGLIVDVNPFLVRLLGISHEAFLGKQLWELGFFKDIVANQAHFAELQAKEYIRYEDRPLETADGRRIEVEFVSNVYQVNHQKVIQCNIRDNTAHHRAAKALRVLSCRQQAILAAVPDIIMEVDNRKVYTWTNQAGRDFFGDDVVGKEAAGYFEGEQAIYESVQPLFDGHQEVIYVETWQRRKDGEKRLLAWWCRILKDVSGNVTGALSSAWDITERKQAEESIRQSEERFRLIMENLKDLVVVLDLDGRRLYNSPSYHNILGDPDGLRGSCSFDEIHPDDRERVQTAFRETVDTGVGQRLEYRLVDRAGQARHIESQGSVIRDEQGRVSKVLVVSRDVTGRKQAEAKQRESDDRYRSLVEDSPDAIGIHQDGRLVFINSTGVRQLGAKTNEELLGRESDKIIHPDDHAASSDRIRRRLAGETDVYPAEVRYVRLDGTTVPVEITAAPITFGGKPALQFIARDISERKRAEEELRWRTLVLESQLEATLDGILIVDEEQNVVVQNRRCVELWRIPRDIVDSRDDKRQLEFVKDRTKDPNRFVEKATYLYAHPDETSQDEVEFKDGMVLDRYSAPVIGKDGTRFGRIWAFRDITGRKQAEAQLRAQADLLNLAQDSIEVRDMSGCVQYWNKACERLTGWTAAEALGQPIRQLVKPKPAIFDRAMLLLLQEGHWHGEQTILAKDGRAATTMSRWTLVRDAQGQPKAVLTINTDLTEQKKLEAQFLRAQRMESVGRLAGGIAHDLNNILAPILMGASLLKEELSPTEAGSLIDMIAGSAQRGADIVKQLLTFARGTEGQKVPLPPSRLIKEMAKIVQETFPKSITLRTEFAKNLWPVLGDPTQLHQVLLNLCVNARDAMPQGGTLTLAAENVALDDCYAALNPEAKAGPYVVLQVADTGTGMSSEIADKIFDPFFTTKGLETGTGLGLATVQGIVKSHEGFIHVESQEGRGTCFKVYLPAQPAAETAAAATAAGDLPYGNGELVLVVDDEPNVRDIAQRILAKHGYRVLTANDGTGAITQYAQHRAEIQVVLTDMMMPVMDGVATIRVLREMNPLVRIIAASGASSKVRLTEIADLSVQAYLQKPFTSEQLLVTLQQVLHGNGARWEAAV